MGKKSFLDNFVFFFNQHICDGKFLISFFSRNTKEPCNSEVAIPYDRKYICRQKFVRITLKSVDEVDAVVDEQFFYPSHCVCEIVAVKRVKRISKRLKKQRCYDLV